MATLWQDLRYGLRRLGAQRRFTALAIGTLALGIGATTVIFSVIQNVLLDPFPYVDANRVVSFFIHDQASARPGGRSFFQPPEFLAYQEESHVFEDVIGGGTDDVLETTATGTEQFSGGYVTPNLFRFLGVAPLHGRGLTPDDARPGAPPVFVMSHKMFARRHGLDPSVLGRSFVLDGVSHTLVGIMPPRFTKLSADLYRPMIPDRTDPKIRERYFLFQARLKRGVTLEQARADLDVIAHRLAQQFPKNYPKRFDVVVVKWVDQIVGQFRATLYTLAAAVGLLLLIACNNVANMLLARAAAREKEMAVRASLGARRALLVRQLLIENLLLALGGCALGCLLAWGGTKLLVPLIPEGLIPGESVIRISVPVLVFSLAVAVLTALVFGLAPALLTARRDIAEPLKDAGKGVSGGFRRGRLRNALVVIEVALSLVLLVGAGLLMRSFVKLQRVDLGLDPGHLFVTRLPLPNDAYKTAEAKQRLFRGLLDRIEALPGVVAASAITGLAPFGGIESEVSITGKPTQEQRRSLVQLCSEGYFRAVGLRLQRGRVLSAEDVSAARKLAVINQTLANKYFPGEDPLGKTIKVDLFETLKEGAVPSPVFEIIGVVADVKNRGIRDPSFPEMMVPHTVTGTFGRALLVRTHGDPTAITSSVRREVWAQDRSLTLAMSGSLAGLLKQYQYAEPRFSMLLLAIFAGVGLLLVTVGVYSAIAYTVSRQTHEIGIRMALGADAREVLRMVLRAGLRLVGIGLLAGLVASAIVARLLSSQIWGISPHDPLVLTAVILLVVGAGLAACYLPARRATRVDPVVALRVD